jgi:hypothetical protein
MSLKGFVRLGDSTLTNDIRENLISYLDYNFLTMGNFVDVPVPSTGLYGGIDSRLRLVDDPRYTDGQVWATFRPNLVWESGVGALTSTNPAYPGVSGIYVNNTFYGPATTGTYAYHIDHINGVVRFNSSIAASSVVDCPHSYKYISVSAAEGIEWFKQIQERSERSDGDFANQSGIYELLPENRQVLPLVGIELAGRKLIPFQLGGGQTVITDFYCHCVAEDSYTRDSLVDAVTYQSKGSFQMYDLNKIADSGDFPLDYRGVPESGAKTFPTLVSSHPGRTIYISDAKLDSVYSLGRVKIGTVKITTEVIHYGV